MAKTSRSPCSCAPPKSFGRSRARGSSSTDTPTWVGAADDETRLPLLAHLEASGPVVLIGNSLGGHNAFVYARRHPDRVRAMVIEESAPEGHGSFEFMLDWRGIYPTREQLEQKIGERLAWSVAPSFRETAQGWTLAFDPDELVAMQQVLGCDRWSDWLGTSCPALVVRGTQSRAVDGALLETMAKRRPNTQLLSLQAGHVTHHDDAAGFNAAVRIFLQEANG